MQITEETSKRYLKRISMNQPKQYKLFSGYYRYLKELPAKRSNSERSNSTNHRDLTFSFNYFETIGFDIEKINYNSINSFLKSKNAKATIFNSIKHFIVYLRKNEIITREFTEELLENCRFKNVKVKRKEAIPKNQWDQALEQVKGVKKFALWLMLTTGVRVGEVITLQITDLDFDDKNEIYFIKIQKKTMEKNDIDWIPKTDNSIRDILIRKEEAKIIKQYLEIRENKKLNHDFLLYVLDNYHLKGERIKSEKVINSWLKNIVLPIINHRGEFKCNRWMKNKTVNKKSVGVHCEIKTPHYHLSPHLTRHAYSANFYFTAKDKGIDAIDSVSYQLGHKNPHTTFQYLNLNKNEKINRVKKDLEITR